MFPTSSENSLGNQAHPAARNASLRHGLSGSRIRNSGMPRAVGAFSHSRPRGKSPPGRVFHISTGPTTIFPSTALPAG